MKGASPAQEPPVLPALARALEAGREEGVAPGLAAAVRAGGRLVHLSAAGDAQVEPSRRALGAADLFDVASLTKPLATATLAAQLVAEGRLELDAPVERYLPGFASGGGGGGGTGGRAARQRVTPRQLLSHASGLPGWRPYFERAAADPLAGRAFRPPAVRDDGPGGLAAAFARGREILRAAALSEPLEAEPGRRALYSDPGFMLLGWIVEAVGGGPLDRLFQSRVAEPLGLGDTFFPGGSAGGAAPGGGGPRRFVATERCEHRSEVNCGAVNDDNAWAAGGVAGHAGLFSTAAEVAALGEAWLEALAGGSPRGATRRAKGAAGRALLDPEVAREFARVQGPPRTTRTLGWDTPSAEGSSLGTILGRGPRGAIGHLGFTGTSLWIDLDRGLVVALLANRVHPSRENERIRPFRPRFHDVVAGAVAV